MIAGPRRPNRTYLVAIDNFAAREAHCKACGGSPEWAKMRVTPGCADGQVVSNITNQSLTPVAGSEIR